MANEQEEISWKYKDEYPHIGIRLKSPTNKEYPPDSEVSVLLDTGNGGGIVLPNKIYYEHLELQEWEKPEPIFFEIADGKDWELYEAEGCILIPKLGQTEHKVNFYTSVSNSEDSDEILIGVEIANKFRLLLNGPDKKLCFVS